MVMVTSILRRSSAANHVESGSSSGESSRRTSHAESQQPPRRPSLGGLSLRLSRSKRRESSKETETCSDPAAQRLGEMFFSLPDEIIVQILCHLSQADIFALRRTCRSVYGFLNVHAAPITRSLLIQSAHEHCWHPFEDNVNDSKAWDTYSYIQTLYPQPLPCRSMDYLLQMVKRQSQINRMLSIIGGYVHMKIYMIASCPRFNDFSPYKAKLIRRLHLAAWTLYHFLDKYRLMLIFEHPGHPQPQPNLTGSSTDKSASSCPSCKRFVRRLLLSYPGTEIIPAYHFYALCQQHLRSLSRAPTYAGSIERKLRGWSRKPPTDADLATLFVMGGIPELCKLNMLKGTYNQRIEVIGSFVDMLDRKAAERSRTGRVETHPPSLSPLKLDGNETAISPASFTRITRPLTSTLDYASYATLAAVPDLDDFIIGTDEWVTRMFQLVNPEDEIVSAFGFVQNVLAGKGEKNRGGSGGDEGGAELDFLAPVIDFD
ncbi:hypothetical protein HRR83_004789 [Exophiala dermatitidis]|uniref:F-box domain-containing protein n=2 Tax=Exophiala dermatitidis TaxID=5970 RepID=H6BS81_EXODN|nr:uncharacterized protein HMPREF1120_02311 [Exophiala dermatitidis NIH/UT8656]KAJ4515529.1 hypothetical protein HRR75_003608 [Exophiala dermatitidis]EHY54136.1 hypothetical protein HMPREF1120_02311 [Exophiala dermatitidis NIH/UT8656]KAJ4519191.1 hypothetical protein HRR74_003932 [Exophiala dermatitidis]KAJ4529007.1 hypothetical protein HRR73_000027 [Exophiala dermatitidis]KAJ4538403.1 hypothetical protein HRR77_006888 [Exophiala dermatitidis]